MPPFNGVAVKVTGVDWQTGLAEAVMETTTGWTGMTDMVTALEVAGFPERHPVKDDVN